MKKRSQLGWQVASWPDVDHKNVQSKLGTSQSKRVLKKKNPSDKFIVIAKNRKGQLLGRHSGRSLRLEGSDSTHPQDCPPWPASAEP